MDRRRLGKSGIVVSSVCMGTMTFGAQADEKTAFAIMDKAYEAGIDFYDTAEVYPIPPKFEYQGDTETIVGKWLKTKPRETVILATKVVGPAHGWFQAPVRSGKCGMDRHHIIQAIEGSLKRLQTDYIDLYQVHWPDHGMDYRETLEVMDDLIRAGKVRVAGSSNETCWGVMKSLEASKTHDLCRYQTVQNNFSVFNRRVESELAQVLRKEEVSLLPYSPLGRGVLTGKYNGGKYPEGATFTEYLKGPKRQRNMAEKYVNPRSLDFVSKFLEIAKEAEISPAGLALAWSKQHDYVASTIFGANTTQQFDDAMTGADYTVPREIIKKLNQLDEDIPLALKEDGLRKL